MTAIPKVKIYHNPECGTSRNTLALIRNANIEPEIANGASPIGTHNHPATAEVHLEHEPQTDGYTGLCG